MPNKKLAMQRVTEASNQVENFGHTLHRLRKFYRTMPKCICIENVQADLARAGVRQPVRIPLNKTSQLLMDAFIVCLQERQVDFAINIQT